MGLYNSKFDFEEIGEDYFDETDSYFKSSSLSSYSNENNDFENKDLTHLDVYRILTEIDICRSNNKFTYH